VKRIKPSDWNPGPLEPCPPDTDFLITSSQQAIHNRPSDGGRQGRSQGFTAFMEVTAVPAAPDNGLFFLKNRIGFDVG